MTLQTEKYVSKVRHVEAVQVTEENIREVAKWCRGKLEGPENEPYIRCNVPFARDIRQTLAYVGDWITYDRRTFKIFQDRSFKKAYEKSVFPKPKPGAHVVHRSAVDGEFVTAEEAEQNPDTTVTETVDNQKESEDGE